MPTEFVDPGLLICTRKSLLKHLDPPSENVRGRCHHVIMCLSISIEAPHLCYPEVEDVIYPEDKQICDREKLLKHIGPPRNPDEGKISVCPNIVIEAPRPHFLLKGRRHCLNNKRLYAKEPLWKHLGSYLTQRRRMTLCVRAHLLKYLGSTFATLRWKTLLCP